MSEREAGVIAMRFGITDEVGTGVRLTLDQIGEKYGVTRERIRQIESNTIEKLRHPSRIRTLEGFLFDSDDVY